MRVNSMHNKARVGLMKYSELEVNVYLSYYILLKPNVSLARQRLLLDSVLV